MRDRERSVGLRPHCIKPTDICNATNPERHLDTMMLAASSLAFQTPSMPISHGVASSSISMKATAAPVSVWADPIAEHSSALNIKDIPFDPLNLADADNLEQYREAEIKHGRLAMLAALGWPAAEFLEPVFSKTFGLFDELGETGECFACPSPLVACPLPLAIEEPLELRACRYFDRPSPPR